VTWEQTATAFGLGFALGAAPGPVQLLILSETSRRGIGGGLRVMLGANGTLLVVMVVLAFGFSSLHPGPGVLRTLRVVGGAFLIYLGGVELRNLHSPVVGDRAGERRELGPAAKGIMSVVVSPGAWVFFATTASAVVADATTEGGRVAALAAGLAMALGVSTSDLWFTLLGSGGRALLGDRGITWLRSGLAVALMGIGVWFVAQGVST
jgi:threonine/homoserine/homoserine lactone efflux protein